MDYYNDHEPYVCAWTRNLIAAGEIPEGVVDERPIEEVSAEELRGFRRCSLFNGLAGWPLALRLAGWPDGYQCWCASLPCQPWSTAGKGKGEEDERHLWPVFLPLVRECKPPTIIGEQVQSKAGRRWLAGVFADLEQLGYACGAADLPAACVKAPHKRQRIFWVADIPDRVGNANGGQPSNPDVLSGGKQRLLADGNASSRLADTNGRSGGGTGDRVELPARAGTVAGMGDSESKRRDTSSDGRYTPIRNSGEVGERSTNYGNTAVYCRDGYYRRISTQPGDEPVAPKLPRSVGPLLARLEGMGYDAKGASRVLKSAKRNRTGRLEAYGNSIVASVGALFIEAYMEARNIPKER